MFESAELGHTVSKARYEEEAPQMRADLLNVQYELKEAGRFPVIVLINGVDGAGRGETLHLLNEWLDPRYVETRAYGVPTEDERERPPMWRFWRDLPPRGKVGLLFGSWYSLALQGDDGQGRIVDDISEHRASAIQRFERMLVDEGALLVKFWFHLSKKDQKKRLKSLEADGKTRWRVTKEDWRRYREYDKFRRVSEHLVRRTSTAEAPWHIVDGLDDRFRSLTVGHILLQSIRRRLELPDHGSQTFEAPIMRGQLDQRNVLNTLDLGLALPKRDYSAELKILQERLGRLSRDKRFASRSLICVFEGNDAAGKGGSIRRMVQALDPRQCSVVPIAAPGDEERAQPYLWRFWRKLPRQRRFTIFDRSWYGRVLVERIEGFCSEADWTRAYAEINEFEAQLVDNGAVVIKFWLAISKDEQLRRFKEREEVEFKRFKITEEDWRNREKWDAYSEAVCDMVDRTSTDIAPWTLVEANDKRFARVKVLRTICERLEAALA
ncbi:MAG: polyphosphate:AMP phosphotransferase [Rhodocyclaceae bacterium]|nr:polyphosphate:AMP phosphotransferase [Rhodocyclaceae bacterium]